MRRRAVRELQDRVNTHKQFLSDSIATLCNTRDRVHNEYYGMVDEVNRQCDALRKALAKRESMLIKELDAVRKEKHDALSRDITVPLGLGGQTVLEADLEHDTTVEP